MYAEFGTSSPSKTRGEEKCILPTIARVCRAIDTYVAFGKRGGSQGKRPGTWRVYPFHPGKQRRDSPQRRTEK